MRRHTELASTFTSFLSCPPNTKLTAHGTVRRRCKIKSDWSQLRSSSGLKTIQNVHTQSIQSSYCEVWLKRSPWRTCASGISAEHEEIYYLPNALLSMLEGLAPVSTHSQQEEERVLLMSTLLLPSSRLAYVHSVHNLLSPHF